MDISLFVAMDEAQTIGLDGDLPWRLPADLRWFKATTMGKPLIMGRKTYESIGRPLPGRQMIVVTGQEGYQAPGCEVVHSLDEALKAASGAQEAIIGGGAGVYAAFLPSATRIYMTRVHATVAGDTFFPTLDMAQWQVTWEQHHPQDAKHAHAFTSYILERRTP